jgi:1-deoxy-D-xylulose-5-phosphate reductoisomerase
VLLGSTGSIGCQTLDVVRRFPDRLRVIGLAARRQEALAAQAREFGVAYVSPGGEALVPFPPECTLLEESEALETLATLPEADVVVVATVGRAGLLATVAALKAGKQVALANKEVLVMAGALVTELARRHGGRLIPVDSEHSALWQCLLGEQPQSVESLILTASGGALRERPLADLDRVTPAEALQHPTWRMGPKVTIDSATLMNKGLEVIEAHWLFDCPYERIEIVLHPTSDIHSLVRFRDGSIKAQIACADMRLPIQFALSYPERWPHPEMKVDITKLEPLRFASPEWERYPCLALALEAGRQAGTYPAALCGADEAAVDLFLAGKISLTGIARLVKQVLAEHHSQPEPSLDDILAADGEARARAVGLSEAGK